MNPMTTRNLSSHESQRQVNERFRLPKIGKTIVTYGSSVQRTSMDNLDDFHTPKKVCKDELRRPQNGSKLLEVNARLNFGMNLLNQPSEAKPQENYLLLPREKNKKILPLDHLRLLQDHSVLSNKSNILENEELENESPSDYVLKKQFETYSLPMNHLNSSAFLRLFNNLSECLDFIHRSHSFGLKLFQRYSHEDRMDFSNFKSAMISLADSFFCRKYDMANDTNYNVLGKSEKLRLFCKKITDWNRFYLRHNSNGSISRSIIASK